MKGNFGRSVMATALAGVFSAGMNGAFAAAFALSEQSGSGLGNSYAGAAAVAEDASTIYFNPAGMSLLENSQFAVAGHAVNLSADFTGGSVGPLAFTLAPNTSPGGGNGGDFGSTGFVPNLYLSWAFGDRWDLGVGINAPFGLVTEYDDGWVGRFQGIKSEILTMNINPAISYKISDTISVGGGINYQQIDTELTKAVPLGGGAEGRTALNADGDGWGWNIGLLWQLSPATRLGIAYRSEIDHELEGDVSTRMLTGMPLPSLSGAARGDVTLPDMLSLSLAFQASDRFQLLADVTRTGWSSIQQINVIDPGTGSTRDVLVLDFDDAWRYSIGGNYMLNDKWTLKAGLAFDETPVKNAQTRTVRIPDNDRTWISFGGQVKVGSSSRIDVAYAHIFIKDADIAHTDPGPIPAVTTTTVTGNYEGSVDVVSVQYTLDF